MKKILIAILLISALTLSFISCDFLPTPDDFGTRETTGTEETDTSNTTTGTQETDDKTTGTSETQETESETEDPNKPPKATYNIPAGGYNGDEVTIVFYHTMGANLQSVLDQYIEKFNEIYPNITIEHQQIGGYPDVRDQIKTELAAGNQPNIAYCYPDHVALYNVTKKVVPLDSFINSTIADELGGGILGLTAEQQADFIPGFYAEGTAFDAAGTMYTLPMSKSTEVLYYNATFFAEHGLEPPTTWDEMEELCEKIKKIDPDCIPLGYDSEANWFITMCEQLDSPYTSITGDKYPFLNDTNKAFVKRFRTWYEKGYVTTEELLGSYTSELFTSTDKVKSYMSIGSSAGASYQVPDAVDGVLPFNVGITSIPQIDPEEPKVISQGPSLCIFDQTDKQEVVASWLFVKFLTTNPQFQAAFSMMSGYMPVINSVMEIETYKNFYESAGIDSLNAVKAAAIATGIDMADAYFVSPAFNGSSIARDKVGELMQYCFTQQTNDIDALIDQAFFNAKKYCIDND